MVTDQKQEQEVANGAVKTNRTKNAHKSLSIGLIGGPVVFVLVYKHHRRRLTTPSTGGRRGGAAAAAPLDEDAKFKRGKTRHIFYGATVGPRGTIRGNNVAIHLKVQVQSVLLVQSSPLNFLGTSTDGHQTRARHGEWSAERVGV